MQKEKYEEEEEKEKVEDTERRRRQKNVVFCGCNTNWGQVYGPNFWGKNFQFQFLLLFDPDEEGMRGRRNIQEAKEQFEECEAEGEGGDGRGGGGEGGGREGGEGKIQVQ